MNRASAGGRATAIYARMFSKAGSSVSVSVYVSVSCAGAATLAAARADVGARLAAVPPAD
ncbi:MAG TPA: hypothetical protein VF867_18395 [Arthrobacter sp.]